jgi:hypothetical protein
MSIITLSIITQAVTILRIMTHSIMTLSISA